MLLCTASAALGVGIAASAPMRTTPLSGMPDRPTLILLSAALGRFVFTAVHLLYLLCRPGTDVTGWTVFRAVYVIVSIICLAVVVITGDNLVIAAIFLLLELGIAAEEASIVVDRLVAAEARATSKLLDRLERVITVIGVLLMVVHIFLPTTVLSIAVFRLQSPFVLSPPDVGLLCFAVVFYTMTALVLLSSKRRRCRRLAAVPRSLQMSVNTKDLTTRQPIVGAMSVDGKRRRVLKRPGAELLLHAVRGRRLCSIDVYNAIRIAAASAKGLANGNLSSQRRQLTSSA